MDLKNLLLVSKLISNKYIHSNMDNFMKETKTGRQADKTCVLNGFLQNMYKNACDYFNEQFQTQAIIIIVTFTTRKVVIFSVIIMEGWLVG